MHLHFSEINPFLFSTSLPYFIQKCAYHTEKNKKFISQLRKKKNL